ncbi:hypothetical protein [Streptomyces sp. NPDC057910]
MGGAPDEEAEAQAVAGLGCADGEFGDQTQALGFFELVFEDVNAGRRR